MILKFNVVLSMKTNKRKFEKFENFMLFSNIHIEVY